MKRKKTRADFELDSELIGQVVRIEWEDPLHTSETTEQELDKEPNLTFTSYGVVIKDNDKRLTIASTIGSEYRCLTVIPRGVLLSTRKLKEEDRLDR